MSVKHTIRKDGQGNTRIVNLTSSKAIKAFCYECVGFNFHEVEKCTSPLCPLFPFRNPKVRKGTGNVSEKSIQALQKAGRERQESTISD